MNLQDIAAFTTIIVGLIAIINFYYSDEPKKSRLLFGIIMVGIALLYIPYSIHDRIKLRMEANFNKNLYKNHLKISALQDSLSKQVFASNEDLQNLRDDHQTEKNRSEKQWKNQSISEKSKLRNNLNDKHAKEMKAVEEENLQKVQSIQEELQKANLSIAELLSENEELTNKLLVYEGKAKIEEEQRRTDSLSIFKLRKKIAETSFTTEGINYFKLGFRKEMEAETLRNKKRKWKDCAKLYDKAIEFYEKAQGSGMVDNLFIKEQILRALKKRDQVDKDDLIHETDYNR